MQPQIQADYSDDVLKEACEAFGIPLKEAQLIRSFSNLIFDCGAFFLRLTHSSLRETTAIEAELDFVEYLASKGIDVVKPVSSNKKNLCLRLEARQGYFTAACFETIKGQAIQPKQWTPKTFRKLGHLSAQLHLAAKDYPKQRPFHFPHWDEIIEHQYHPYLPVDERQIPDLFQTIVEDIQQNDPSADRYGLIHYDIHHGNYLIKANNSLSLLDFEMVCRGWWVADLGTTAYYTAHFRTKDKRNPAVPEAAFLTPFLSAYQEQWRLSPEDMKLLHQFILYRGILVLAYLHKVSDRNALTEEQATFIRGVEENIQRKREELGY